MNRPQTAKMVISPLRGIITAPFLVYKAPKRPRHWFFLAFLFLFLTVIPLYCVVTPFIYERLSDIAVKLVMTLIFVAMILASFCFCIALLVGAIWGKSLIDNLPTFFIFTFLVFLPLFALVPYLDAMAHWTFCNEFPELKKIAFVVDALLFVVDNLCECIFLDIPQIFDIHFTTYKLKTFAGKFTTCVMRLAFDFVILGFILQKLQSIWKLRIKSNSV